MRFLVVTTSKHLVPPEAAVMIINAMHGWLDRHAGKIEETWGFAGLQGGGGILNVDSLDELDQIMTEFPFAPFSNIDIYGLTDIRTALDRVKSVMEAMTPPQG